MNASTYNWNISTVVHNFTHEYIASTNQESFKFNTTSRGLNDTTIESLGEFLDDVTTAKTWISSTLVHKLKPAPDILHPPPHEPQVAFPSDFVPASVVYHTEHRVLGDPDISHGHIAAATVLTAISVLVIVIAMWIYCRRNSSYEHIVEDDQHGVNFVYKPLIGTGLDDEYENTFVGVSIPLLQDNTKL